MRINEIFLSLQGEGHFTGTPAVFLRFSGCNLSCPFCDTKHETFTEMSEEELVREVTSYPVEHVVITGGEPGLQLTKTLVDRLHQFGRFIQIETNGSMPLPHGIDWVTCSPKEGAEVVLEHVDEVKMLYSGQGCDLSKGEYLHAKEYRLQPLDTGDEARNKQIVCDTINYILEHPKWKLSLQTHKILNVR